MVKVLDIPFYDQSIEDIVPEIIRICTDHLQPNINLCISASGAHGLVEAHQDPAFKNILQSFWLNLPDGMPTVWVGKLKGANKMARCYGPDFFKAMMLASANKGVKHFFCGGREGVANALKEAVQIKFGNSQVVGTFCPPFRNMTAAELEQLGNEITQLGAHIVWIGLSTPKQEKFAAALANYCKTCFIVTVGAAFDFHTDQVKQAPAWMQQSGLEWLFRLLMEPKRLYKRYFTIVPMFIWLNIKEFADFCINKKKKLY
jgi:N-acetylglucosaminyldiphosphoundecaprenol N-acetyl-beta-D-mannosaminyltransferase